MYQGTSIMFHGTLPMYHGTFSYGFVQTFGTNNNVHCERLLKKYDKKFRCWPRRIDLLLDVYLKSYSADVCPDFKKITCISKQMTAEI